MSILESPPRSGQYPMTMSELEERTRELEGWAREHKGKTDAKWEQQTSINERMLEEISTMKSMADTKFGLIFNKLSSLEIKIAVFTAIAALIGSTASKYIFP